LLHHIGFWRRGIRRSAPHQAMRARTLPRCSIHWSTGKMINVQEKKLNLPSGELT
jgi:hypothetical protein